MKKKTSAELNIEFKQIHAEMVEMKKQQAVLANEYEPGKRRMA